MIFWDVDTQRDFLLSGGRLYVPGAEAIVPQLERLTAWARDHFVPVISSACAHHPGDPEFAIYGPHCLAGTPAQQKIPETLLRRHLVIPNRPTNFPDLRQFEQVILEKDRLDVFTNPNTEAVLAHFGEHLEIVLYGVVTEICVALAARGLLARGHRVRLVSDAVRHLDARKAEAAVDEICGAGGELVTTEQIVGPSGIRVSAA
jgi:nicotinamidase-related amidase